MGASNVIREIRRSTRRRFSPEEKIRIVVEGLRGEVSVSELCRREEIAPAVYYRWSKSFLEAGKNYLYRCWKRACDAVKITGVDLYGGTRHSTTSALSEHFSLEQLRRDGTMHATNKAFERYMQTEVKPSKAVYEKVQELARAKNKGKVIPMKKKRIDQQ